MDQSDGTTANAPLKGKGFGRDESKGAKRGSPWLIRTLETLLLVAIIFIGVRAVITFLAPSSVWPQADISLAQQSAPQPVSGRDVRFTAFDPFHRTQGETEPVQSGIGADAPETKLKLKLTGRRAGPNGSAVLKLPDNSQANFHIGDEIIDGVELRAVTPIYIVIEQSGRLERLTFDKQSVMGDGAEGGAPMTAQQGQNQSVPSRQSQPQSVGGVNLDRLMRENTLSTVRRDGKSIGIRVTPKSSRSSLSTLGLQPGDIIQRIGTVDVSGGMPSPNALMRSLQGKDSVSVTILRGDKTLKVDISQ